MKLSRTLALALLFALAGCGGGGGSSAAPAQRGVQAQIRLAVPGANNAATATRRRQLAIASNTAGVTIAAYTSPRAQNPMAVAQGSFDISSTSSNCTATAGGGRTCTLAFALPNVATDDFVVTTYDTAPSGGTIPQSAKQLGIGITAAVVLTSGTNTVPFTVNGVVAGVAVLVSGPPIVAVSGSTHGVSVQALDAAQNTIVTDAYSDASGNPVSIALGVTGASSAHFQVAPASISVPMVNGVTLTYAPSGMSAAELANGFSVALAATPSNGGTMAGSVTIAIPVGNQQFTAGFHSTTFGGLALGADNNVWFLDALPSSRVGKISESGTVTEFPLISSTDTFGIVSGPDNNLWFTEGSANNIGRVIPGTGVVNEFPIPTPASGAGYICSGPDGNLWFTEAGASKIGRITTAGVVTEFTIPTVGANPIGITSGPDGALWFTEQVGKIGRITTAGAFTEFVIPTASTDPYGITAGPDGALWFAENGTSSVGRVTTGGTFSQVDVSPVTGALAITSGPDGNLWVTSTNGNIARVTTGGTATIFPNGAASPQKGILGGPDGNIWYTLTSVGIGKIVL